MPKVITETAVFTPTVTVPVGTDSRSNAAEAVEAIAQALANRSRFLQSDSASRSAANTFAGAQTFNGATSFVDQLYVNNNDAERAALAVDARPSDSPIAGNKWKVIGRFRSGGTAAGGQYVGLYTGRDGTDYGAFAVVVNASWDADTQLWVVRDTAIAASALIWRYDGVYYSQVAPGPASFATWPRTLVTPLDISALAQGNINIGVGSGGVGAVGTGPVYIPIRLPSGAIVSSLEFLLVQISGVAENFNLMRRNLNWSAPSVSSMTNVGHADSGTATGTKSFAMTPSPSPLVFDGASEYVLVWDAISGSRLEGVRVNWTDPGLRNY